MHHELDGQILFFFFILLVGFKEVVEDLSYFFGDKWNRPREKVHEVREKVGVWALSELLDIKCIVLGYASITSNLMTAPLLL